MNDIRTNSLMTKIAEWDGLIKAGRINQVRNELTALKGHRIPRSTVCDLCQIAKRTQMNLLILKWLKPFVREFDVFLPDSTATERALYASALMRIGAHFESKLILENSSEQQDPQIILARAHLEIFQWNYSRAIPFLRMYLRQLEPASYPFLVGQLNLAAAYVAEHRWLKAEPLVELIMKVGFEQKHWLIYANALELYAQIAIHNQNYDLARERLQKAKPYLLDAGTNYEFFLKKWETVIELMTTPPDIFQVDRFDKIKSEAAQRSDWETLRELDLFLSLATKDRDLFLKVYFGTRQKSYHLRMKKIFKDQFLIPPTYIWSGNQGLESTTSFIDLKSGQTNREDLNLGNQPLLLKTLQILMKDSYSPLRVAQLMEHLYPGEFFDSVTSPQRIYRAVYRLRKWLKQYEFPLAIKMKNHLVSIEAIGPIAIKVYRQNKKPKELNLKLETFLDEWTHSHFSTKDVQKQMGLNERATQRILKKALEKKAITRIQNGRNIFYKVA
jgi:hypothetical protein